jgi:DNA-binding LacI/PurR family transcriptional regulator
MSDLICEVMKRASVSRATAYRALNDSGPVSEDTRKRVLAAAAEIERTTGEPTRGVHRRLALWIPGLAASLASPHHLAVLGALEAACSERGLSLQVIGAALPEEAREAARIVRRNNVRGVLTLNLHSRRHLESIAGERPLGVFFFGGGLDAATAINPDDFTAGYLATEHLISRGHRRIFVAVGAGRTSTGFSERFVGGYCLALAKGGLQFDEGLVHRHRHNLRQLARSGALPPGGEAFLKCAPRPTALIGRTETVVGVMRALDREGLRTPDDVSVVGYGPEKQPAWQLPPLSQVTYDARELAEAGLDSLSARLRVRREVALPVAFESGESIRDV